MKKILDRNSIWFGMLVGMISPAILFFIFREMVYYITLWTNPVLLQAYHQTYISDSSVFLISIVFNVIFFRPYLKKPEYEMTGRGIMVITMILTFVFVALKMDVFVKLFS